MFELRPDERFTIRIDCVGGAYLAFGDVNSFDLKFDDQSPSVDVTPAILAGPHSVNRVRLHLVFSQDAPPQSYFVTALDEDNNTVDTTNAIFQPARQRPYRVDVELVVRVQ